MLEINEEDPIWVFEGTGFLSLVSPQCHFLFLIAGFCLFFLRGKVGGVYRFDG
jgi:hypothetical protein